MDSVVVDRELMNYELKYNPDSLFNFTNHQNFVSEFENGEVFQTPDSIDEKPIFVGLSESSLSGADSLEIPDFSDACIKFLGDILLEEGLDDTPATVQDYRALQATEKSLYDVLGEEYSPTDDHDLVSSLYQSIENTVDGFDGSFGHSRGGEGYGPKMVQIPTPLEPFLKLDDLADSFLQLNSPSSGSSNSDDLKDRVVASPFSTVTSEITIEKGKIPVARTRRKNNRQREDVGNENGRGNKQQAASNEDYVEMEEYDDILLCREDKDDVSARKIGYFCDEVSENLQKKGSKSRTKRGKKPSNLTEEVDLRTLLNHCAQAVSSFDLRSANERLKQIRQHSSPYGDSTERIAHHFANALEARIAGTGSTFTSNIVDARMSSSEFLKAYRAYVTAIPFKRVSYFLANNTIRKWTETAKKIHIIDFGILLGLQWPCFIQALSKRPGGPPEIRFTGIDYPQHGFRPAERVEATGRRLSGYSERFNVPFKYQAISQKWSNIQPKDLKIESDELVIVNCMYRSGTLLDETVEADSSKDAFLKLVKQLNPHLFIHGVINGTFNAPFFLTRFKEALFYYSALFDVFESTIPREEHARLLIESELYGKELMNIVACEGTERVQRPESFKQWQVRTTRAGFKQLPLDRLRSVSLAYNRFSGTIPSSLSSCVGVSVLNLSNNVFSGSVPRGIYGLHGLRTLDLSGNVLSGVIPSGMNGLFNLRTLDLSRNRLSGAVPEDIGRCSLLKSIDFSENLLSGNLPVSLLNLSFVGNVNLRENLFMGSIPEWIGRIGGLESLDLSANNFSGALPYSMGSLRSLKVLNVSMNSLTEGLPETMVGCVNLQSIDFRENMLSGELPKWIFKVGLQEILLSKNKLSGTIDSSMSSAETISYNSLQVLDLSKNSFIGGIPENVGELKALKVLDLSNNRLKGSIPSEIGGATSLRELMLERNLIVGSIPTSLEHCTSLTLLDLSHNSLKGPVPLALSRLGALQIVDLSFNDLSGSLPKQLENLQHLLSFNISHNYLQGELPGGFFNTISPSSVTGNPSLCGSSTKRSCATVLPKPIVLNPNSSGEIVSGSSLPPQLARKRNILSISALIAIGAAAVIVIGVIAITVLNLSVKASASHSAAALALSNGDDFSHSSTDANSGKLVIFSGESEFSAGTHALLNKDCELGRGGFGAVYRTVLQNGRPVAIKKLTVSSLVKSQEDFEREVKKLGKIRHSNLVSLEGYYWTTSLQLLIYEFVSGGSLYKHLHEGPGGKYLSWNERFNIILGMAKGLSHLHQLNVIHYNLKSSNILIGESGEPKVGDFGLARLLPMLDRYILSSKIQSALGYMAPEFACRTVKITEKCDIYGFGVLVLEVVTGKRPVEYMDDDVVVLCDMVRGALEEGKVEECVDERLQGKFPAEEAIPVIKLGLICTSQVPSNRPDMREVINILELIRCPSEG